jgi:hypothetical protein
MFDLEKPRTWRTTNKHARNWQSHRLLIELERIISGLSTESGRLPAADWRLMSLAETNKMGTWVVCRQDDNGNRFVVRTGLSRDEAERMTAELESHGHKQLYWVEPERPPGTSLQQRVGGH